MAVFSHSIFGGQKKQWLVAFYGYGQSEAVYEKLYEKIEKTHNLLVIHNPMQDYHTDLQADDLKKYLEALFQELDVKTFHSVSYSMGSRLNLYLPQFFGKSLSKIIIIAPDGITFNFWNRVAISTPWGRRIFKYFVENGTVYMKALLFFYKIGVVNKSMYAFSKWNMRDDIRRKNVYNAWMNMRFLRPDLKKINRHIEANGIKLISYFGKKDLVIPLSVQKRCVRFFPNQKHVLIESDHNILNEKLFTIIAKEIQT